MIYFLIACLLSAILYRAGGAKGYNTKFRDLGCPAVFTTYMLYLYPIYTIKVVFLYFLTFLLSFGALTTYWDWVFGYDNFWFSGFILGLSMIPFYWIGIHWYAILIRAFVLAILWGSWCAIFKNDKIEEFGRGGFIILTTPILLI
jgi:hypothetical protein